MGDVLQLAGAAALGSRFRRLSEKLVAQASEVYKAYNVPMEPSWFPVMYSLMQESPLSVSTIAEITGQSHPFVSKTTAQMKSAGLLVTRPSEQDKRVQLLSLSDKALTMQPVLEKQIADIGSALNSALNDVAPDFLEKLGAVETLLSQTSLLGLIKQKATRGFRVIDYSPEHRDAFYQLNKHWIERYFTMESSDHASLGDPENYILKKGGHVLLVQNPDGDICGTVALIAMDDDCYELAKMAVADSEQGKGLGALLGEAAIQKARDTGAKKLYLESNRKLAPAISLYRKLGFKEVDKPTPSPYARCDIQMLLML